MVEKLFSFPPLNLPNGESPDELVSRLQEARDLPNRRGKAQEIVVSPWGMNRKVSSWKFNEWDYGTEKISLPSQARGLFTYSDDSGAHILVRGYDKFFNVEEVATTKWSYLEKNTKGPYYLSLKENGCIIFVSVFPDTKQLVVCSKHSTGPREDQPDAMKIHSYVGMQHLKRHLQLSGQTEESLASALLQLNATAVFELCDDEFEEHVLEYSKQDSGLYLHGLNSNTSEFATYPCENVDEFADKFGFFKAKYLVKQEFPELRSFLESCAKTGSYQGKSIEGFVIRCKNDQNRDFFWKYKFEEPYLMYRQWREMTKAWISGKPLNEIRINKHVKVSEMYLQFAAKYLTQNPEKAKAYQQGHGIIALREEFLKHIGKSGTQIIEEESLEEAALKDMTEAYAKLSVDQLNFVLITVATIGCGKTTVAQTLVNLFPSWGHIQNDNISGGKNKKSQFVQKTLEALTPSNHFVISDRNNPMPKEREQMISRTIESASPLLRHTLRFICLDFLADSPTPDDLWRITSDRVFKRGDDHQSIRVSEGKAFVSSIMEGFIKRYRPVDPHKEPDNMFDLVIPLSIQGKDSSRQNVSRILEALEKKYPNCLPYKPTAEQIDAAFEKALNYKPEISIEVKGSAKMKKKLNKEKEKGLNVNYFSISIDSDAVHKLLSTEQQVAENQTIKNLIAGGRLQKEFHITLNHSNMLKTDKEDIKSSWDALQQVARKTYAKELPVTKNFHPIGPVFADIRMTDVFVWDGKLACIACEIEGIAGDEDPEVVSRIKCVNLVPHSTLGTTSASTKPYESNSTLVRYSQGDVQGITRIPLSNPVVLKHQQVGFRL